MGRQYNRIYSQLVQGDDDLLGMVAYSIYKKRKIEFIANHGKGELTEEQLNGFHLASEAHIEDYVTSAEQLLHTFVANYSASEFAAYREKLEKDVANHREKLEKNVDHLTRHTRQEPFMRGVGQGVVASFLFVFLMGCLAIAFRGAGIDTIGAIERLLTPPQQTAGESTTTEGH